MGYNLTVITNMFQFPLILLLFAWSLTIRGADPELEDDNRSEVELNCRQRTRLVTDEKDDQYNIVEGDLGEAVKLQCHFCDETDDGHPKSWFKMDPMDDAKRYEVELDMDSNMSLNRVHTNPQHTLTIHNLTKDDRGEYFCKGLEDDELANKYNFLVDVVIPTDLPPEKGNMTHWRKYHDEQLLPINKLLQESKGAEINYLTNELKVKLELETSWGRAGPCEICGRPKGDGRRYTEGHCRAKITRLATPEISKQTYGVKMIMRSTHLSCRSITLYDIVPGLINRTAYIPDFILVEVCDGICNPDAKGVYRGWRSTKKGFKYKKTFVLAENAHLTLICPESTLENHVEWKINNQVIKAGESKVPPSNKIEPRVFVDSFNTLYLYGVTKEEEGNYTCYVDKTRMQQVRVFVVSKSRLLTQAFVRHMMYLAFVLSLTLSCYCAGLIVTYVRKHKFKTYRQARHELKVAHKLLEDDVSEITISDEPLMSTTTITRSPAETPETINSPSPITNLPPSSISSPVYHQSYDTPDPDKSESDNLASTTTDYTSPTSDYDTATTRSTSPNRPLLSGKKRKKVKTKKVKKKKKSRR